MSNTILTGTLAAILLSASTLYADKPAADSAAQKDRQQYAGTWRVSSLIVGGKSTPEQDCRKIEVINQPDGSWSLLADGKVIALGYNTFQPAKRPKTIDLVCTQGSSAGKTIPAIYELGAKSRKLCFRGADQERPKEFASTSENGQILVTFERVR